MSMRRRRSGDRSSATLKLPRARKYLGPAKDRHNSAASPALALMATLAAAAWLCSGSPWDGCTPRAPAPHGSSWPTPSATPAGCAAIGRCCRPCGCSCLWGDFDGGYVIRDGLIAGHDYLIARWNLLQQSRDFRGLRRRLSDRTVREQDLVVYGARTAGPAPGHCVRGEERAGRPTRRECVSPVGALARHRDTRVLNRAMRELDNDTVDQSRGDSNWHTDKYCCAAVTILRYQPVAWLLVGQLLLSLCAPIPTLSWVPLPLCAAWPSTMPPASTSA